MQAILRLVARAAFGDPAGGLGAVRTLAHEPLRPPRSLRAGREELTDDALDRCVEIGRDLVHQPDPERRLRVETLAGDEVAPRRAGSDSGQRERGDDRRDDPELHLREGENRIGRSDRDVARSHEPRSAAEGVTLHAYGHRRGTAVDRLEHRAQRVRVGDVLLVREIDRGAHPVDVGPGREARSVAAEDDGPRAPDSDERLGKLGDQRRVERVPPVGPRECDAEDVAVALGAEVRGHGEELRVLLMLRGALAAAVTPLRDGRLDADAVGPYVDFLASHGLDGVLVLGTTGEGVLFSPAQRQEIAQAFLDAASGRLQVAVHAGAQTTHDTVALAEHAAAAGAAAVAVIAPPYFALDEEELFAHFEAAAHACAPLPFYLYEFETRSGYAIPLPVIERLREHAPNLAGLKVSDSPWEKVEPYLLDGLDIFIGAEALLTRGLVAGAAGAVSGLASCFPDVVVPLVRDRTAEAQERATALRAALQQLPFHAAAKAVLGLRGVPVGPDVRAPLRGLTGAESAEVERIVEEWG